MQDREETSSQQRPDAGPDADEKRPDAPIRGSVIAAATGQWTKCWQQTDRTQDISVRSSTERFQSDEIAIGYVWWHVTGRWQRPIS